jgi:hypothetical protein
VPVIAGVALAIAGGVLLGLSAGEANKLRMPEMLFSDEVRAAASNGRIYEGAGMGMLIGGLVVLAAGVLWLILGSAS